jgi:hypothetical protein
MNSLVFKIWKKVLQHWLNWFKFGQSIANGSQRPYKTNRSEKL